MSGCAAQEISCLMQGKPGHLSDMRYMIAKSQRSEIKSFWKAETGNFDPAESMSSEHRGGVFLESPVDFECNRSSENSAIRAYFHASL